MSVQSPISMTSVFVFILIIAILSGTLFVGGIWNWPNSIEKPTPSPSQPQTPTPTPNIDPSGEHGDATIYQYDIDRADRLTIKTEVFIGGIIEGFSADMIVLCAYDDNGEVLDRNLIGNASAGTSGSFQIHQYTNVTTTTAPSYLAIDHPGIRGSDLWYVEVLEWDPEVDGYRNYRGYDRLREAFDFPRTQEPGVCG